MTTQELLQVRRKQILTIARRHGVTSIRVFGSVVRHQESGESDIDLLITTGPEVSSWFPAGFVLELEELLGRRVDVVTEAGLNPDIRDEVMAEAVSL